MLQNQFGYVILQKDSELYHTTDDVFQFRNDKSLLFCTFHPNEWYGIHEKVIKIKLKKDVILLFMIRDFNKSFIYSALNHLSSNGDYLSKMMESKKKCFIKYLQKAGFDGWLSSIENRSQIEVALINSPDIYDVVSYQILQHNWRNGNNLNNKISIKDWGKKYEICTIKKPVIFYLNKRMEPIIQKYIDYSLKTKFPLEYAFQVILSNATIYYYTCDDSCSLDKWLCFDGI